MFTEQVFEILINSYMENVRHDRAKWCTLAHMHRIIVIASLLASTIMGTLYFLNYKFLQSARVYLSKNILFFFFLFLTIKLLSAKCI